MTGLPSGTVTFLFTDIEGSTKLAREHPAVWDAAQRRHHQILRAAIESHNGYVFQVIGDAFCAAFHRAGDALRAAYQAQHALRIETWGEIPIRVRMGIHTGEAEAQGDEYRGYLALSLVQRLMSAGYGGQILVSGAAENLLRGQLPDPITLHDLGRHLLRDVPQPVRVFQVTAPDLPDEFPPLRNIPSHPNNLPNQLTSFVGREKELADVQKLLLDTHLLTLIGPGGTGKTRLSIQVASDLLDRFPDGLWLVELAPILDPLLVPRVTAMTMGLRDEPQRPVIDMVCDYLREKKMLIILDNCEHLVDACARMADRILHTAPDVRILASSREALGIGGEVTYRVPSLGLPNIEQLPTVESLSQYEAVKLFIDRARSAIPTFSVTNENAPAVAQICHRLDGIPLAIELAAAKIRVLNVEQIATRLDDRFRLLTGGSRTAMERHQTLRATLDWSHNLLPEKEQFLFRRLSIFINGWTLEAAESVCSDHLIPHEDVFDLLEQLVNKSLVIAEDWQSETRYHMLETMRQYANAKLVEAGESNVLRDQHLEYFLALAEAAEPHIIRSEQLEWLAKLDADYENLRLALEWALNKESAQLSLRLCAALGQFWSIRCHWLEGTRWLSHALAKPAQHEEPEIFFRAKALYQDAALAEHLDDFQRMKKSGDQSLMLTQGTPHKRETAIARFYMGWAMRRQNDYDHAIPLLEQSLADFQELKDRFWEMKLYSYYADILVSQGKITAKEKLDHDFELARAAGERNSLAEALLGLGFYHFLINQLEEARKYADEANKLFDEINLNPYASHFLLGALAWVKGDYKEARRIYTEMQNHLALLGEKNMRSIAVGRLGSVTMEAGDFSQARIFLEESLTAARELQNHYFVVIQLLQLGNLSYFEGQRKAYKQKYREGLSLAKNLYILEKFDCLFLTLKPLDPQGAYPTASILGALHRWQRELETQIGPLAQRDYDRAERHARQILGDERFESAFQKGQTLSIDEVLALALRTVEEI